MIIKIKRNYIIVIASAILKHKTKKKTCKNGNFLKITCEYKWNP